MDQRAPRIKDDRVPLAPTPALHPGPHLDDGPPADTVPVLVACPDARPPAYQAVVGLARAGMLDEFDTGFYHGGQGLATRLGKRLAPDGSAAWSGRSAAGTIPRSPPTGSASIPSSTSPWRWRTAWARLASERDSAWPAGGHGDSTRPSRDGSGTDAPRPCWSSATSGPSSALPACRELGITSVLSMVHGDVREEVEVLEREAERSPDFFPIYLADGPVDRRELAWLHDRRLRDIALADRVLVPSDHIAGRLIRHGTPADRVHIVPYAADCRRFVPDPDKRHDPDRCTFLFAGGITQRKGIKYLLEAWRQVRRPGWRLQLLGGLPADSTPLGPIATKSSGSAGWGMPMSPASWPAPTSSCSPRCSRDRPS